MSAVLSGGNIPAMGRRDRVAVTLSLIALGSVLAVAGFTGSRYRFAAFAVLGGLIGLWRAKPAAAIAVQSGEAPNAQVARRYTVWNRVVAVMFLVGGVLIALGVLKVDG